MAEHDTSTRQADEQTAGDRGQGWRSPVRIMIVVVLVIGVAFGGWAWWSTRCHDDWCAGSTHHVTISVRVPGAAKPACWNDVGDLRVDGRVWESHDHAPAAWATGPVTGTLRVTSDGPHGPFRPHGQRTASFTADRGGSVTFFGGTPRFLDDLDCVIG